MSRRKRVLGTVSVGIAIAVSLLVTTLDSSATGIEVAPTVAYWDQLPTGGVPGHPESVEDNFTIVKDQFLDPFPSEWGGAYVDGETLVVKSVSHDVGTAGSLLAKAGVTRSVVVVRTDTSIAELKDLTAKVMNARLNGVRSAGPQYATSTVIVGVSAQDKGLLADLYALGGDKIVAYGKPESSSASSRYFDLSPFHGGARIRMTGLPSGFFSTCTSGFAWNGPTGDAGKYFVTAGHCYRKKDVNDATYYNVNRVSIANGSSVQIGTVVWSSVDVNGTIAGRHGDTAVYRMNSGNSTIGKVWDGPYDASTLRLVTGQRSLPEGWTGQNLYTAGAGPSIGNGDGEVQLDVIPSVDQSVYYVNGDQVMHDLSLGTNASECVAGGDSGGPVYLRVTGGQAHAVGIVSGNDGLGWGPWNCTSYFTPIGFVKWDWGGTLKVAP